MSTFAETLATQIRGRSTFWSDLETVSSLAFNRLIPGISQQSHDGTDGISIKRLLQSASVFCQTDNDSDKALAQDLAIFSALASNDNDDRDLAKDVLCMLGNFPGAQQLSTELNVQSPSLISHLRYSLLRAINTVPIADRNSALTDFQKAVWTSLPKNQVGAISAPTSAGKSYVVIEYLCQQAMATQTFTAVFLAPTRALINEIHSKVSRRLREYSRTTRISIIPTIDSEQRAKQIFVLTQERLQVLLASWEGSFDLVIVDEAQSIGDDSRGMILQTCLETITKRNSSTRFIFLAPGATGFESLTEAIGFDTLSVSETQLSPVVQNRIIVEPIPGQPKAIWLTLLNSDRRLQIGTFYAERGFAHSETRLAAVALELGSRGGSLVYGTGPADADAVAGQIASALPKEPTPQLEELSKFIEKHVHRKYSLVKNVLKGVGVHYGKMPSLLREAIEEAFKSEHLKYLVCTTTLFQGVNLPARNVFIDTPTRGRGSNLDPASLWNFAGRAGRLGQDIVGNVFLVGYDSWESKPLTSRIQFAILPSFRKTIIENRAEVLSRLRGDDSGDDLNRAYTPADAAAGLLISKAADRTLSEFMNRTLGELITEADKLELLDAAMLAHATLNLPKETFLINWTVNPFGQKRLLDRFREKIAEGAEDELIPLPPFPVSATVWRRYVNVFSRINKYILNKNSSRFSNKLTALSLAWMRGSPLPIIIKDAIRYAESRTNNVNYDSTIRGIFEFIEDLLRFKYVQLGRAYIDLLRFALNEGGKDDKARGIYDFPLALELGVSSVAGQAFIELGLSRISASALESLIPDSDPTVEQARMWLSGLSGDEFPLSKIIWGELSRKGLIQTENTNSE